MKFRITCYFVLITSILFSSLSISEVSAKSSSKSIVQKISYKGNKVIINVKPGSTGRPKYKYNSLSGGRFYIDILNSQIEEKLNFSPKTGRAKKIIRGQFNPTTSRIVIYLKSSKVKPSVSYASNPSRFIIDLNGGKHAPVAKKSLPKKTFMIVLDPGHGGWDPGTTGKKTLEKIVTLDIALKLEKYLLENRNDVKVKLTRRKDVYVSLEARKKVARKCKADLFISIHANGSTSSHINQTEIYYQDNKSKALAKIIRKELLAELKQRDGGVRKNHYTVIRKNPAKYGSVLIESDYLTNKTGEKNLRSDKYKQKVAKGIYDSIDTFLNSMQ